MNNMNSRRHFLKNAALGSTVAMFPNVLFGNNNGKKNDFPLIDYHVHLTNDFTIEKAVKLAEERNMKFGIVEHPGFYYAIKTDKDLEVYINKLRKYPVYVGLQPVYPNWADGFSKELIDQLDYVLMDAIVVPRKDGNWDYSWRIDFYLEDKENYMKRYMKHIEHVLTKEHITIFGWTTFLPVSIARDYNEIWTEKRMKTIVDLAKENNIAIEINEISHVPNEKFIKMAKAAGLKFTFGTDARNYNAGRLNYCQQMIENCGLTKNDMLML